ncbi:MAG: GAF domain-containing protein, partial [Silvanigrellales bacterium]|nr:GAF domain-containing protein [Silvanigrellales bacterium]
MNRPKTVAPKTACESAIPVGAVQRAGVVFCFESATGRLAWTSDTDAKPLSLAPPDFLARLAETPGRRLYRFGWEDGRFDICAYRSGPYDVVECLEAVQGGEGELHDLLFNAREALESCDSIQGLLDTSTQLIRRALDADGCMALAFSDSGAGQVVSETRKNDEEPRYLGLWFPASDVPPAVRALYSLCPVRIVFSVDEVSKPLVNVLSDSPLASPPDLSSGYLRAVAPAHLKYMTNMGTKASLSLAIFCEGRLWGLVLCHFSEKLSCRLARVLACQLLAEHIGARMHALLERESERKRKVWLDARAAANRTLGTQGFLGALEALAPALSALLDTSLGLAFVDEERITLVGSVDGIEPSEAFEAALRGFVNTAPTTDESPLFATDCVRWSKREAGGALVLEIGRKPTREHVVLFRAEAASTVKWAGKPKKCSPEDTLTPRSSFALWQEEVRGHSLPWTSIDLEVATEVRASLVELRLAAAAAEESRARGRAETAALVMHDLGNQLTGVYGWSLEINREVANARASAVVAESFPELATIERHLGRLGNCLTSAMELLRINQRYAQKGGTNLLGEGYAFLLDDLLDQLDALFPQRYIRKGGKFTVTNPLPRGIALAIDRTRFLRILLNIAKNSFEACDAANVPPHISLVVRHTPP